MLTHEDSPATLFSTARHESRLDDPDDTRVLDPVLRFRGQRVAVVVAESLREASRALRLIEVEYEVLPAVVRPGGGAAPGAPLVHGDKGPEARISEPGRNVVAQLHARDGRPSRPALAASAAPRRRHRTARAACRTRPWRPTRRRGWLDEDGRLVLRTSTQVPYLVRDELAHIFDARPRDRVRVLTGRVGGGFGGKQELLTEDVVALAVLRTGRPVQYEMTRADEFTIVPSRHPVRVDGASWAPTPTACSPRCAIDVLTNTGAYGNHGPGVMFHGVSESVARVPVRRTSGSTPSPSTPTPCRPARSAGTGSGRSCSRIESAMDELARSVGIDPFELRRRNVVVPGDRLLVADPDEVGDLDMHSYGLDQCLDLVERRPGRPLGGPAGAARHRSSAPGRPSP